MFIAAADFMFWRIAALCYAFVSLKVKLRDNKKNSAGIFPPRQFTSIS
jgi:hypothetical protein